MRHYITNDKSYNWITIAHRISIVLYIFIHIYDNWKKGQREEVLIKYLGKQTMELMFIPSPSISHLIPMVELAKLLTERDDRLMIKIFIMKQPSDSKVSAYIEWLNSSSISNRIQFINLPSEDEPTTSFDFFSFIESEKPNSKMFFPSLLLLSQALIHLE